VPTEHTVPAHPDGGNLAEAYPAAEQDQPPATAESLSEGKAFSAGKQGNEGTSDHGSAATL
jgi:hypothetical protein